MANAVALIRESIWRDRDFRALTRTAQCSYFQLLSQKDLDCAGILILNFDWLTKGCDEMSVEFLRGDLKALEQARFIVLDEDSGELLIRSYVRLVSVCSPNIWKAAKRSIPGVESPKIRSALAGELRRLHRADADELANQIDAGQYPSETLPKPLPNPSERVNPSGTLPKPPDSVQFSTALTSVGGLVGEPPPKFCLRHMPQGTDKSCHGCQAARQNFEAWDAAHADRERQRIAAINRRRLDCPDCDDRGLYYTETDAGEIAHRCERHP